jgi:hypothetical protein
LTLMIKIYPRNSARKCWNLDKACHDCVDVKAR